jgi:hypothetical protein
MLDPTPSVCYSELAAAVAAKFCAGWIFKLAGRTQAGGFGGLPGSAAFAAEAHGSCQGRATIRTSFHFHTGPTIIAEFALAAWFAALGADQGLAFDFTFKDLGLAGLIIDIFDHFPGFGCRNRNILAGSTRDTKFFLFIEISITGP